MSKPRYKPSKEQFERWKAELDAATKVLVARISSNPGLDIPTIEAQQAANETITQQLGDNVKQAIGHITDVHERMAGMHDSQIQMHNEAMQNLGGVMRVLTAPKKVLRGPDGRVTGVEVA